MSSTTPKNDKIIARDIALDPNTKHVTLSSGIDPDTVLKVKKALKNKKLQAECEKFKVNVLLYDETPASLVFRSIVSNESGEPTSADLLARQDLENKQKKERKDLEETHQQEIQTAKQRARRQEVLESMQERQTDEIQALQTRHHKEKIEFKASIKNNAERINASNLASVAHVASLFCSEMMVILEDCELIMPLSAQTRATESMAGEEAEKKAVREAFLQNVLYVHETQDTDDKSWGGWDDYVHETQDTDDESGEWYDRWVEVQEDSITLSHLDAPKSPFLPQHGRTVERKEHTESNQLHTPLGQQKKT